MTVGSFSVRAVTADGHQLVNCAAISTGPGAALACVKRGMGGFPDGTRFFVRGGAPSRPHDYAGEQLTGFWLDESSEIGNNPADHVAALADIGDLERAIEIVAAAMPELSKASPAMNTCFTAADAIRQLINGGSLIASCDWEYHPTHVVFADTQPNGRLLLSIRARASFQQEGSQ